MKANIEINNLPSEWLGYPERKRGFMVVRYNSGSLWYYGFYGDDKDRAEKVAREIGNGIAIEVESES